MSKKFVTIKVNPEDTEHPENREALMRYEVRGYPTIVFASSDGGMIAQQEGFIYPNEFAPVIEAALEKEEAFSKKLAKLKKKPDDAKLNAQVALTYLERKQLEKAVPFSEKAFELDPRNKSKLIPNLHNQLGLTYATALGAMLESPEAEATFEKAVSHFKTVIDKYPKSDLHEHAQFYLGVTYGIKGHFKDAIAVLEKLAHHTSDEDMRRSAEARLEQVRDLAESK